MPHKDMDLQPIIQTVLKQYTLPLEGHHGVSHWARVLENGRRLSEETGANIRVVSLFAVFHDSRRINESIDPGHGQRGAELAAEYRGNLFELEELEFDLLYRACAGHTDQRTHSDVTIQTCWDADRLDIGRVGIVPEPEYLNTEVAKRPETIQWADDRARIRVIPELIAQQWGIELL